jgi:hypothetical protein
MNTKTFIVASLASLSFAVPSTAATPDNPMGIAIGKVLVADYGKGERVTAMFANDGTVALTFPDGAKSNQQWVADSNFFCMIATPGADGKMGSRCERNLISGKALGQHWKQVDSEGLPVDISIQPIK